MGNLINKAYYLKSTDNIVEFERQIREIKGILNAEIEQDRLTYQIDEWTSDYDVFVKIMEIADSLKVEIDFDRGESVTQESENQKEDAQVVFDYDNVDGEENSRFVGKQTDEQLPDEVEQKTQKPKKAKTQMSDKNQRLVELAIALASLIVMCFTKGNAQLIFYAITFTFSCYEIVYSAVVKAIKKDFFNDDFILSLSFIGSMFLGYDLSMGFALLLLGLSKFLLQFLKLNGNNDEVDKYLCVQDKVVKAEEVELGSTVVIQSGDTCIISGTVLDLAVVLRNKEKVELDEGEQILKGDIALCEISYVTDSVYQITKRAQLEKIYQQTADNKGKFYDFVTKNNKIINIVVVAVCLLITFIMPIFGYDYSNGLYTWGNRAVTIIFISSLAFTCLAIKCNLTSMAKRAFKSNLFIGSYQKATKIARSNNYVIDLESVFESQVKVERVGFVKQYKGQIKQFAKCVVSGLNDEYERALEGVQCDFKPKNNVIKNGVYYCDVQDKKIAFGSYQNLISEGFELSQTDDKLTYMFINGSYAGFLQFSNPFNQDAFGMVRELKDLKAKRIILISNKDKEVVKDISDKLKIGEYAYGVANENKQRKANEICKDCVYIANDSQIDSEKGVNIAINYNVADNVNGVGVLNDEIAMIPVVKRLCKRTDNKAKFNFIVNALSKILLLVLILTANLGILWAVLIDVIVSAFTLINSQINDIKLY